MNKQKSFINLRYAAAIALVVQLTLPISVLADSLEVDFSASPASGPAPLENVDLHADVSGSATGPITYKFDCRNDGTWEKIVTTNNTSFTASDLCSYSSPGNYIAKVSVGRGGLFFEGTTAIMVNGNQDLVVSLSANPQSGPAPLRDVDLKATVSGSGNGELTYKFDCTGDGDWEQVHSTNSTTYTAVDVCDYKKEGNYTARVRVERGGLSFLGSTAIVVSAAGGTQNSEHTLKVTKTVRNITRDENAWKTETSASPGDTLEFRILIKASGAAMEGVVVRDILPGQMTFVGNLRVDGSDNSGDIEEGINIGTIRANEEKTVTFEARVKPAENFQFGSTTLLNTASAKAEDGTISTSIARVIVTKTGVLGAATSISTGGITDLYGIFGALLAISMLLYLLWQGMLHSQSPLVRATARRLYLYKSFLNK